MNERAQYSTIAMPGHQPIEEGLSVSKNQTVPVDRTLNPR
jgi:hypothetical protein